MIGKLFIPLAIGGGLMFLLASSAGASPSSGPAQKNPFDQLPDNLRQLAGQAQATNNPDMLEQVAAQLEAQGFREQPRLLRAQAAALRQGSTAPTSSLNLVSSPGLVPTASSAAPAAAPAVLSPDLQKMVADAIQNGTPPILTSTAFVLEKAGFQPVADELRRRAKDAAANVPPPAAQDHPNASLDPNMPADLALQVARQLQLQGDPNALEALVTELRKRGFNNTADQVEAKAQQIRTMLDAARTMHDIDNEFKSPGIVPQQPGAATSTTAPASPGAPATGAPPTGVFPVTVTATPPAPVAVPSSPRPLAPAPEKSKAQILAEALSTSLNDLLERYGSVPKARYKEDKGLVQRFQSQEGLTADGSSSRSALARSVWSRSPRSDPRDRCSYPRDLRDDDENGGLRHRGHEARSVRLPAKAAQLGPDAACSRRGAGGCFAYALSCGVGPVTGEPRCRRRHVR